MKLRKKRNISEESYWKSSTDIMAGVLLVILLVVMLLLLYLTQMKTEDFTSDAEYDVYAETLYNEYTDLYEHQYDHQYDYQESESGGGGGEDDPGTAEPVDVKPNQGNDKAAVFVTVVDEETGNAIKKDGIIFELYTSKSAGGLQTLHTYYPIKTEYKQYETTNDGTFYLPEKIAMGEYSLHNLTAPEGYGIADDFDFEVDESKDWAEPYFVEVPMSPSKNRIYVRNYDATTKDAVGDVVYNVYAAEDIVTLDGSVRYKSGEKVDEIECNESGNGSSKKLYLGKYYIKQSKTAAYYALNENNFDIELKITDTETDAIPVSCEKTRITVTLTDEYTESPIEGAVYSVTDKEDVTTNDEGRINITDLSKDTSYTITLESVPENYRISAEPLTLKVDESGYISGETNYSASQTAYMIRLSVDIKDMIFKNSVSSGSATLRNSSDEIVEEWDAVGEEHLIEGIEPGTYSLVINNNSSSSLQINVKDVGTLQKAETQTWTLWDTILVVASVIALALAIYILIRIVRRIRRKKANDHKEDIIKEK